MDIKCTTCGKDVTPLELYDGCWACPSCRSMMRDFQTDFVVNADNEELFVQSELLYASWLFNRDGRATLSTVEQAVELCRRSARMGNPKALARLAFYYDKNYVEKIYGDVTRCKIAYTYYSAICYSGLRTVKVTDGLPPVKWEELCERTAYSMLYMLASAPAELQASKTYNLQSNLERVHHEMGLEVDLSGFDRSDGDVGMIERVFSVLCSCVDKRRAPLFGAFRLRVSDIKELYKKKWPGKEDKIPQALAWLTTTKKVVWSYIRSDFIKDSERPFSRLSTENSVKNFFAETGDEEWVWTFFFNHNGGHKYLSSPSRRNRVENTIYDSVRAPLLKRMLQNGNQDLYVFYDDDVYFFMRSANEAEATRVLVNNVCRGGNEV